MMKRFFFLVCFYFFAVMPVMSQSIKVGPFFIYEQAQSQLEIDGVTAGYKFGAAGLSTDIYINNKSNLMTDIGFGYVPSETITFGGASFSGPFSSRYFSSKFVYNIKKFEAVSLNISSSFSHRHAFSNSLIGTKNSATLDGKAVNIINSLDAIVWMDFLQEPKRNLLMGIGLSVWSFKATGLAANLSDTVRAIKNISTIGTDPLLEASFINKTDNGNIELGLKYRSLNSKFKSGIFSLGLKYNYAF